MKNIDPVKLTSDLIKCPSVTPNEAGALSLIEQILCQAGFKCKFINRNNICNLFARWGEAQNGPTFCFNGHIDVVPPGDLSSWSFDPFSGQIDSSHVFGRGATDMKSALAAFISASSSFLNQNSPSGSVVIIISGDEEGKAIDGTRAIMEWMQLNNERIDDCLVGEPTSQSVVGDTVKIGRRGSLTVTFEATGLQGHVAYPEKAKNPLPALTTLLSKLVKTPIDIGSKEFDPSSLVLTTFDTGNPTSNVIPKTCTATINIRFNNLQSPKQILSWLKKEIKLIERNFSISIEMVSNVSAHPFVSNQGLLSNVVEKSIQQELQILPKFSTSGGTSDARFIYESCPVIEFGLVGSSMHKIDEAIEISQIECLTRVYHKILEIYFKESKKK